MADVLVLTRLCITVKSIDWLILSIHGHFYLLHIIHDEILKGSKHLYLIVRATRLFCNILFFDNSRFNSSVVFYFTFVCNEVMRHLSLSLNKKSVVYYYQCNILYIFMVYVYTRCIHTGDIIKLCHLYSIVRVQDILTLHFC